MKREIANNLSKKREQEIVALYVKKFTILQLVEKIIVYLENNDFNSDLVSGNHYLCVGLAERLGITSDQAMWLAILINMSDDHNIHTGDIAEFLHCRPISVLSHWDDFEALARLQYITIHGDVANRTGIMVPACVLNAFRKNEVYHAPTYSNISIDMWLDRLGELMHIRINEGFTFDEFMYNLVQLIKQNKHLGIVKALESYNLEIMDKLLLLCTLSNFVQDNDEQITFSDICDVFEEHWIARKHAQAISLGKHNLQITGLIENVFEDGQANANMWHLTDKAKDELLAEVCLATSQDPIKGLTLSESLQAKQLFFNATVTKSVDRLRSLLEQESFANIQKRLEQKGMRRGFACIFYGAPGTGKTETVYQIARETGRNIMMVDVPNLRSKWVGDTEKNVKAVFDKYRSIVKRSAVTPILLFNEADAVLCRRSGNAVTGVDKMENAMQNIILQEMENLDGIMIATTNLIDNLDKAFERRFLYKIEFSKPSQEESKHIWMAMLPELSEEQAQILARTYNFSGGQIENIARKQIVDGILNGDETLNMDSITEACSSELLRRAKTKHVGFE